MIWLPAYAAAGALVGFLAGLLGIAEGTSKSQVFKARLKLRALLR